MQGIEPAAGLVDGFGDVVGLAGILLEEFFVFEGVVPLCHRHGTRVKPAVGHIGDAAHGAVDGIFPGDFVDIGAVQVEVAQRTAYLGREFGYGADTFAVETVGRNPDGQRSAPIAFAANGPVDVVGQPVAKAAVFDVLWHPLHFLVGGHQAIFEGGGADVPAGFGKEQQWCFAAPTEGVGMFDAGAFEQIAPLFEYFGDDRVGRLEKQVGEAE